MRLDIFDLNDDIGYYEVEKWDETGNKLLVDSFYSTLREARKKSKETGAEIKRHGGRNEHYACYIVE